MAGKTMAVNWHGNAKVDRLACHGVATHTLPKDLVAAAAGQKCDAFWHHLCIVGILLAAEPCRPAPDER